MKADRRKNLVRGPDVPLLPYLQGLLPTLKRAQRRIAQAVVDDPERFISRPIYGVATDCGVSAGSIVLFCKSMGLRGFPALKIAVARELSEPMLLPGKKIDNQDGIPSIVQRVFDQHIESLRQTLRLNTVETLNTAAKLLIDAKRIVLFSVGLSYPVAYSLYARLRFIGFPAFIEFDSHMQLAAAAEIGRNEVALAVSVAGSTSETVECLRLSQLRRARTICITNSVNSPLARAADVPLYAAPSEVKYFQAPLASRVTQLALADVLLVLAGLRRKSRALAHLRHAEEYLLKRRVPGAEPGGSLTKRRAIHFPTVSAARTPRRKSLPRDE
jgi:RpiR family carbohydrate utilization transcriptional regulator